VFVTLLIEAFFLSIPNLLRSVYSIRCRWLFFISCCY